MEYPDIIEPAKDVCRFDASYQNAVNFFKQYGFEGDVHLAMALLAANIDVVWYTFDENSGKLLLTPAFKKFCKEDFEPPIDPSSITPIKGGAMLCRNSRLYWFDNVAIHKIMCLWYQGIIRAYAALQGASDDCEFRMVKAYTIGKTREFVAAEWVITDNKYEYELYYPIFTDDLERFYNDNGDFLGPLEFDYEPLNIGDTFIHNGQLWVAGMLSNADLCVIKKSPHLSFSVGGNG